MLKIDQAPQFTAPVVVNTAAIKGSFTATFVAMPTSELKRIEAACASAGTGLAGQLGEVTLSVTDIDLPIRLAEGLSESDVVAALTDWPGIGPAMQKAYYKGLWEEEEKN